MIDESLVEAESLGKPSRRQFLSAAAGGFALTAGGVLVPDWLRDGAEAADHPVRRIQERKRRSRARRRHRRHRRNHGGHNQDGSSHVFSDVAIYVHNYRAAPVNTIGWEVDNSGNYPQRYSPDAWYWAPIPAKAANGTHAFREFLGAEDHVYVQINEDHVVVGLNEYAPGLAGTAIYAGDMDASHGPDLPALKAADLKVWQSTEIPGIKVTRVPDANRHIVFSVDLT